MDSTVGGDGLRFVLFYHSLVSDWNHGNAHFLRGIVSELLARGHQVQVYEPADGWSRRNLLIDHGPVALDAFDHGFPELRSELYDLASFDLERVVDGADVVMVHEWNEPELVNRVGQLVANRRPAGPRLLFHDTYHRMASQPEAIARLDLQGYDAVLAFGSVLARLYRARGLCRRAFVWHQAADVRRFFPRSRPLEADLVWVGDWDDERSQQLTELIIEPVVELGLSARVYGARYPSQALAALARAGIEYRGWLPSAGVPEVFARHRVTMHVPRRQYAVILPGIPTIRPFEALACSIPLVSAPWSDREALFCADRDYLVARDGREMKRQLSHLLTNPAAARKLADSGLTRIRQAHTCTHRVDELLGILRTIERDERAADPAGELPNAEMHLW
jgi:spore maturation protein CgeB